MRRPRRSPMGGVRISRRWEIGLPLTVLGALLAGSTVNVRGGAIFFWAGAALVAIGAAAFFTPGRRR